MSVRTCSNLIWYFFLIRFFCLTMRHSPPPSPPTGSSSMAAMSGPPPLPQSAHAVACGTRVDLDLYASSVSSVDLSPTPRAASPTGMRRRAPPRPDSPRPALGDASAMARARLRQLVVWRDAAEDSRDASSAVPVSASGPMVSPSDDGYMAPTSPPPPPPPPPSSSSHLTPHTPPLQKAPDNSAMRFSRPSQPLPRFSPSLMPLVASSPSVFNKQRPIDRRPPGNADFTKGTFSAPYASTSSASDDDDGDDEDDASSVDDPLPLPPPRQRAQAAPDRTKPSPFDDGASLAPPLSRRRSLFTGRRSHTAARSSSHWWMRPSGIDSPSSCSLDASAPSPTLHCLPSQTHSSTDNQQRASFYSLYGAPRCRIARRPQSFHRYARIVPDMNSSPVCRESAMYPSSHTSRVAVDEFDDLVDGLHATKVTETHLHPS